MTKESQNARSAAIIGGADGPTSVFFAGKPGKLSLKARFRNCIRRYKRRAAEKKITPGVHTLEELVMYASDTYGAVKTEHSPAVHIYEIKAGSDRLEIEIDPARDTFGVSFACSKKTLKHFQKITKDLHLYYGVSENDIREKTERYRSLINVLSM